MATDIQTEFTCMCGKHKGWISEGITTQPCPACGRVYRGREEQSKRYGVTVIVADLVLSANNTQHTKPVRFRKWLRHFWPW